MNIYNTIESDDIRKVSESDSMKFFNENNLYEFEKSDYIMIII